MLGALVWLLGCQLVGEVTVRSLGLPFPGPVVGMLLLFGVLVLRGGVPDDLLTTGHALLRHLMLLLVPATTAVMLHVDRVGAEWLPIVLAGIGGAAVTLVVTALTLRLFIWGPRKGPQTPQRSGHPGGAVAPLDTRALDPRQHDDI